MYFPFGLAEMSRVVSEYPTDLKTENILFRNIANNQIKFLRENKSREKTDCPLIYIFIYIYLNMYLFD